MSANDPKPTIALHCGNGFDASFRRRRFLAQPGRTPPEFCIKSIVERLRRLGGAALFGWGRKAPIDERAKLIARMVGLVIDGLRTKSYEQFVLSFSNPGAEPGEFERGNGELYFQMRISPTCWYNATADYSGKRGSNSQSSPFKATGMISAFLLLPMLSRAAWRSN